MRPGFIVLHAALVAVLALCPGTAPQAKAAGIEYLMVPSAAMNRDIPLAFQAGGPHVVVLLDAFNAAPDVSNWVTAGNAMNTLAGRGSPWWRRLAAPTASTPTGSRMAAGSGRRSCPVNCRTGWRQTRVWPGRARDRRERPGRDRSLMKSAFHPDRYRYAGSMSGFFTPSDNDVERRDHRRHVRVRRC